MDFSYSASEQAFRDEIRAWLAANVPGDFGTPAWPKPTEEKAMWALALDWTAKLHEAGWIGIDWPKEYGGRAASAIESFIFQEELSRYRTPRPVGIIGVGMAGPTIMAHGTDAQKAAHLKNILSGEDIWCQGFSEPNAGSDLAALKTSAVENGSHYVLNGQKIWTSYAHLADWCLLLARTDANAGGKHRGMTYFIVDMKSPGIDVRPLRQLTGDSEFNEVFFKDVEVPKENILGAEGNGWSVAITTLMHERVNIAAYYYGILKRTLTDVVSLTKRIQRNGRPLCEDPIIRQKLARFYCEVETQRLNNLRMRAQASSSDGPGPIGSIFKLLYANTHMALLELPLDILGPYAELLPKSPEYNAENGSWMPNFLRSRANSIEGGTNEILLNILADRVLGLPR